MTVYSAARCSSRSPSRWCGSRRRSLLLRRSPKSLLLLRVRRIRARSPRVGRAACPRLPQARRRCSRPSASRPRAGRRRSSVGTAIALDAILLTASVVLAARDADRVARRTRCARARRGCRRFRSLYLGLPIGAMVALRALRGRESLFLLLLTVMVSDTAQYYSGRAFGRRPLAPAISPKKTIEGAIGGFVFGTAAADDRRRWWLPGMPIALRALVGAASCALGIAGDLFESMLKRSAGREGQLGADSRPRRRARSHRRAALRRADLLRRAEICLSPQRSSAQSLPMKRIAILGSTGSIGQSALAVVDAHPIACRSSALRRARTRSCFGGADRALPPARRGDGQRRSARSPEANRRGCGDVHDRRRRPRRPRGGGVASRRRSRAVRLERHRRARGRARGDRTRQDDRAGQQGSAGDGRRHRHRGRARATACRFCRSTANTTPSTSASHGRDRVARCAGSCSPRRADRSAAEPRASSPTSPRMRRAAAPDVADGTENHDRFGDAHEQRASR